MRPAHYEKRYLPSLNLLSTYLVRLNSTNRGCRAFFFSLPLHSLPSHLPLSTHLTGLRLPYLTNSLPTIHHTCTLKLRYLPYIPTNCSIPPLHYFSLPSQPFFIHHHHYLLVLLFIPPPCAPYVEYIDSNLFVSVSIMNLL